VGHFDLKDPEQPGLISHHPQTSLLAPQQAHSQSRHHRRRRRRERDRVRHDLLQKKLGLRKPVFQFLLSLVGV
jgi:hypothetical protein